MGQRGMVTGREFAALQAQVLALTEVVARMAQTPAATMVTQEQSMAQAATASPDPPHTLQESPLETMETDVISPSASEDFGNVGSGLEEDFPDQDLRALAGRAAEKLLLDCPPNSPLDSTLRQRPLPRFPEVAKEVHSTWGSPLSTPDPVQDFSSVMNVDGADKDGYLQFPPSLFQKAYLSAGEGCCALNTLGLLQAYQVALLDDLPATSASATIVMESRQAADTALRLTRCVAQAMGRAMGACVVGHRHLWLAEAGVLEGDRAHLLDAPYTPGKASGGAEPNPTESLGSGCNGEDQFTQTTEMAPVKLQDCSQTLELIVKVKEEEEDGSLLHTEITCEVLKADEDEEESEESVNQNAGKRCNENIATEQRLVIRVILSEGDIRKIYLLGKPDTVEGFQLVLQEKLGLEYKFSLQYEDPEFSHALCNLTDMADLPEKATVKVVPVLDLIPVSTPSTPDTEILSDTASIGRQNQWPEEFEIPIFPVHIEFRLRQGNLAYMKDGTYLAVPKDLKHEILENLAGSIYSFKAYPTDDDVKEVAAALVKKHHCLCEPGSRTGCCGWKISLKFKMGNYRAKLRRAGCLDVAVNGGKRRRDAPEGEPSSKNIKRPKKCEVNFLPNFPEGEDQSSLEAKRKVLVEEMKKRTPNVKLVKQKMDQTFALRRKEVVETELAVPEIVERWPALFTESQVFAEFNRIASRDLKQQFYEALDRQSPHFIKLFQRKKGHAGQILANMLKQTKTSDVTAVRTMVLRGIPIILGDDPTDFFITAFDSDAENSFSDVPVGVLVVEPEDPVQRPNSLHLNPSTIAIILEGTIVMDNLQNLPQAMCILFGLIYALYLNYPKGMKTTFEFIQRVLLALGQKTLPPKLLTLNKQLSM